MLIVLVVFSQISLYKDVLNNFTPNLSILDSGTVDAC